MSVSVHVGIPDTPPEQTPPGADTPWEQTPPSSRHPPRADTPQSRHIPWSRHPSGSRHPPEQTPPGSRHPPQSRQPPEQTPQSRHPPGANTPQRSRLWHTVNERLVRILLECILVVYLNFNDNFQNTPELIQPTLHTENTLCLLISFTILQYFFIIGLLQTERCETNFGILSRTVEIIIIRK